jgi:signal transduction histidine kinase
MRYTDGRRPGRPQWPDKDWEGWDEGLPPPPWPHHRWSRGYGQPSGQRLFLRFALVFGLLVLLGGGVLVTLAVVAVLFFRPGVPHQGRPFLFIFSLIGLAILLALALRLVGGLAVRRVTSPLSDTMRAANALAGGDLTARVPVRGSREFRHLADSFNRMAGALETADRQRRELLADVAHELRTPLTVVQGNLEGLRDGVYQPTPEHLDLILDETLKLGRLVDDLRLLTLAEAGQLSLDLQALDVPQLLADLRDAFACQADEAGIKLTVEAVQSLPRLTADPQRLGQVLGNLIGNALRHTPRGGHVTLGAALAPAGDAVRLWVADTGEGIAADDLPRIFDRFWRGDPARSHEAGAGTGLGLAIARSLVEAHGGSIWANSQPGQGTTVFCLLPLSQSKI